MSSPAPIPTGLAARLRTATRTTHDSVDGAFPHGLDSLDAYARYLRAVLPLVQWLHDSWRPAWCSLAAWHDPARLQRLRADLSGLGAAPGATPTKAPAGSTAEWLGGCYVLEGSALGARLLARDLARLEPDHPQVAGARSFIDALVADPRRWPRFKTTLDSLPDNCAGAALRGAHRGFALVDTRLKSMEAPA